MALQWKATVEPKVEVEATVQLEVMCGRGCRLCYTQLLSMPRQVEMSADSKPNVVLVVLNDGTSVCAVSMNATVVVTGWLESWMQFKNLVEVVQIYVHELGSRAAVEVRAGLKPILN